MPDLRAGVGKSHSRVAHVLLQAEQRFRPRRPVQAIAGVPSFKVTCWQGIIRLEPMQDRGVVSKWPHQDPVPQQRG